MEWLLGLSAVFNVLFGLVLAALTYGKITAESETRHAREEWNKWECRFYEAQGRLLEDHNLFVAPTMGEFGKMVIKEQSND